jgi:hypothetical protein
MKWCKKCNHDTKINLLNDLALKMQALNSFETSETTPSDTALCPSNDPQPKQYRNTKSRHDPVFCYVEILHLNIFI